MPIRPIAPKHPPVSHAVPAPEHIVLPPAPAPVARQRIRPVAQAPAQPDEGAAGQQARPYEIGYRKPPKQAQFKPGRSGNPKGRPKAAKGLKTITRELLIPKVTVRTAAGETRMTRIHAVLHKLMEQAMKGNPRAITHLISLYANAVPDLPANDQTQSQEALTPTDEAILAEFKAMILSSHGDGQ